MSLELNPGEQELKSGRANLQRGRETVGGRLTLTNQRMLFTAHQFNVQSGATEIPLEAIRGTRPVWTKFLNLIPLAPNSLAVLTIDGTEFRFVLSGRSHWQEAIGAARPRSAG